MENSNVTTLSSEVYVFHNVNLKLAESDFQYIKIMRSLITKLKTHHSFASKSLKDKKRRKQTNSVELSNQIKEGSKISHPQIQLICKMERKLVMKKISL